MRQTESTVGRRGMRGRTWPPGWPALPWAQARFHLEVRARTHRSGEGAGKARNEWPAPGFDPGSWSDWFGNQVITKRRPDTYPPNTHTHTPQAAPYPPVMGGFLYWALLRCSSTSLGVTQITCWPFQYLTMLRDWRVLMMSFWVILVIWLQKGIRAEAGERSLGGGGEVG